MLAAKKARIRLSSSGLNLRGDSRTRVTTVSQGRSRFVRSASFPFLQAFRILQTRHSLNEIAPRSAPMDRSAWAIRTTDDHRFHRPGYRTRRACRRAKQIDLRTKDGVAAVKGQWRYSNVKIVEVPTKGPDGKPTTTYAIEPMASGPEFDDSTWEVLDPTTLDKPRSTGRVCFNWYRIKVTIPEEARGKRVFFQTTVDDYGEVWINGKLPRKPGRWADRSSPASTSRIASN